MNESPGKAILEVEEQLQSVLMGLQRFQRASAQLEQGRESLAEVGKQVQTLVQQASESLQPALDAVATLRRLDPDTLLGRVTAVASAVQEQLSRVEHQQTVELQRTRAVIETAVTEIQGISRLLPTGLTKIEGSVAEAKTAAAATRPYLYLSVGLGVVNLLLVVLLLMR